ncbi:unnamed protein product [Eruca vesicaria subsp. sativa]|uniref:Uncharacterized protein n=1 Tax=Eruca vesicaria subsp. sativa TaxID=29727 RepID=A0ABC8JWV1_ERUVS|nr:unnamed protein product [Eruca vesicaria subsp. sativa]
MVALFSYTACTKLSLLQPHKPAQSRPHRTAQKAYVMTNPEQDSTLEKQETETIKVVSSSVARLSARCLSAVSAYDNTLENVETLDTAQAKFDDILNSSSVDAACEKIRSLAKAKELDSSLILLINSAYAAAKESQTVTNEAKDIMYHLYKATKSSLRSITPKEIKLLKYLLNITDPEERFSALATANSFLSWG